MPFVEDATILRNVGRDSYSETGRHVPLDLDRQLHRCEHLLSSTSYLVRQPCLRMCQLAIHRFVTLFSIVGQFQTNILPPSSGWPRGVWESCQFIYTGWQVVWLFKICLPRIRIYNYFTPLTVPQLSTLRIPKHGVWYDLETVPHICRAITMYLISILASFFRFLHLIPHGCLLLHTILTYDLELRLNFGKGVVFNKGIINPFGILVSLHPVWLMHSKCQQYIRQIEPLITSVVQLRRRDSVFMKPLWGSYYVNHRKYPPTLLIYY